ncbi:MAG: acyl-CoA dehydrogenase family protein, partial [Ilumatobacter sp.]|nr:acyl-CoA dehydrogenase family protein [Ilumatobacter sp.]
MSEVEDFRAEVRAFFDRVPSVMDAAAPPPEEGDDGPAIVLRAKAWRAALFDAGLAAFSYPAAFGGRNDRPDLAAVFQQESHGRIPPEDAVFGIGVGMALPVIRDHGTDELRERFLRPGLRGDEVWC